MNRPSIIEPDASLLAPVPEAVRVKLVKNVNEMLMAGMVTTKIASLLGAQGSYGKHVGCTPKAILEIANDVCRKINAEQNKIYRDAMREAQRHIVQDCPSLLPFLRKI